MDWAEGRSDFDVPHRAVLGAELDFGLVELAGFYRFQSGAPFTPGFRPGVDANGDGAFANDPAFVDDQIPGVTDLFASWDCLREQVGRFAERNACRGPGVHTVDVRLTVVPLRLGPYDLQLVVDALNLIEPNVADRDGALYLVDRGGSLTADPATGAVTVPLVVNPNFGRAVVRRGHGRQVRVGVRIGM